MGTPVEDFNELLSLPAESLGSIANNLNFREVLILMQTNKTAYHEFSSNEVWRCLCEKYFPEIKSQNEITGTFKQEFQKLYKQAIRDISRSPKLLQSQSEALLNDRSFIKAVLLNNGKAYDELIKLNEAYKSDSEMVNAAIIAPPQMGIYCTPYPEAIFLCDESVLSDKTPVLNAQKAFNDHQRHNRLFRLLPNALKQDEDILLNYLSMDIFKINELPVKNNVAFNSKLIRHKPRLYEYLSPSMKENIEVIKALVCTDGSELKEVPQEIRNNREIATLAIAQYGRAIQWTPFGNDEELVNIALESDPKALCVVDDKFKKDFNRVLDAFSRDPELIPIAYTERYSHVNLNFDVFDEAQRKQIVTEALQKAGYFLEYTHEFQDDFDAVFAAVNNYGKAIKYASKELQNNEVIVEFALRNTNKPEFASGNYNTPEKVLKHTSLQCKVAVISKLLETEPDIICDFVKNMSETALAFQLVSHNGLFLQYLKNLQNDKLIVGQAIQSNPDAIQFVSQQMQQNEKVQALYKKQTGDMHSAQQLGRGSAGIFAAVTTATEELAPDNTKTLKS
jgi:hypothetical protein